jgi:hypothetical protein
VGIEIAICKLNGKISIPTMWTVGKLIVVTARADLF